jgi:chaperonin GroES
MKLRPLNNRLIVEAIKDESKSSIIIPDTVDGDKPEKGKVLAIGNGKLLDDGTRTEMSVKVGDVIIFKKYSPDEIKIDGIDYLIMSEDDVLAVL